MTRDGNEASPARPRVFVVQPVMDVGRRALEEIADVEVHDSDRMIPRDVLLAKVQDCDYLWMLGDTPIDEEVIAAAPRLKGIATMALFPNVVDVEAATRRGLPVTVVPHVITKTTCDLTCALVLGLFWRLVEADRFVRDGRFHQGFGTDDLEAPFAGLFAAALLAYRRLRCLGAEERTGAGQAKAALAILTDVPGPYRK